VGASLDRLGRGVHPGGRSAASPREVTRALSRHVLDAGVPIIRLHDLRHTHATLALAAGVHPKVVQERLGHANIAITLDTYSHAVPALEEEAARTVAALVFGQ
jgi:integrase